MKNFLGKNIIFFFSFIIFGGLLWGISGFGYLMNKNWNIINLLFETNQTLEALIYIIIAACSLAKTTYNILWDRPRDPPYMVFIISTVVVSGIAWGIIGISLLFGAQLNPLDQTAGTQSVIPGIIAYTCGIFALIKLFNFIHTKKGAE